MLFGTLITVGCSGSDDTVNPTTWEIGDPTATDYPEDYYAGGLLGTTAVNTATAFEQPSKAVENAGMMTAFNEGEYLFEKDYNTNTEGAFHGLGPVYVRRGCLYCHPGYGHGARQTEYKADNHRNGYLLVIYDKTTNAYIRSVAGMPQTGAVKPFKAPIDENQIRIAWNNYTDEWGNQFPDGETYSLIYPEVTIPYSAYYAPVVVARGGSDVTLSEAEYNQDIGILLESTIGIYGTGMTDAIPDEDITAQWKSESDNFNSIGKTDALNPALTTACQFFERTLDDSANKRIAMTEAFLGVDAILNIMMNVCDGLVVYEKVIRQRVTAELPFMATENIMMDAVKKGGNRQELHERLRVHSQAAAAHVKQDGVANDLASRIAADPAFGLTLGEIEAILAPERFTGRSAEQVTEYLDNIVRPLLEKNREVLGEKQELTV